MVHLATILNLQFDTLDYYLSWCSQISWCRSILISINIAVFLFELASPIRNSDLELFSVPLVYGAKINHLILLGEWWRLLTPMFLVQDWWLGSCFHSIAVSTVIMMVLKWHAENLLCCSVELINKLTLNASKVFGGWCIWRF